VTLETTHSCAPKIPGLGLVSMTFQRNAAAAAVVAGGAPPAPRRAAQRGGDGGAPLVGRDDASAGGCGGYSPWGAPPGAAPGPLSALGGVCVEVARDSAAPAGRVDAGRGAGIGVLNFDRRARLWARRQAATVAEGSDGAQVQRGQGVFAPAGHLYQGGWPPPPRLLRLETALPPPSPPLHRDTWSHRLRTSRPIPPSGPRTAAARQGRAQPTRAPQSTASVF